MEAVMEAVAMEPRESGMRKMRTRETAAAEMRYAHPTEMRASAQAADVHAAGTHPSSHPAMHPSPHPAMHATSHAATVTTASKHR
jgi:hypothetical protein